MKIMLGTKTIIATLVVRGARKPGVGDELERWMEKNKMKI